MIDMITQMELEDAVKTHARVAARVKEVALKIAKVTGEINPDEDREWLVDKYSIDLRDYDTEDRQHLNAITVTVWLTCAWADRPSTQKFGEASGDDPDPDSEYFEDRRLSRMVRFPRRYLTTHDDTWIAEVEEKARARKKWFAEYNLPGVKKAIEDAKARQKEMEAKYQELLQIIES